MGKTIGLLLGVAAMWATLEIYTKGSDQAFGGLFASPKARASTERELTTPRRAGAAVERAHQASKARYENLLPE